MKTAGTVVKYKQWWEARISYTDHETGRRIFIRRKRKTKTEANSTLFEMKKELKKKGGVERQSDKLTFSEVSLRYERENLVSAKYRGGKKISGLRSIAPKKTYLKALRAYFNQFQMKQITYGHLERFRLERLNTPTKWDGERSVRAVNAELQLLNTIFRYAIRNGWLERNPFESGKPLIRAADETRRERVLTYEEESKLLAACIDQSQPRLRVLIILAVDTGMRRGEMLKLERSDVDFDARLIRVRAINSKTGRAREIGMTERVFTELKNWLEQMPEDEKLVFGLRSHFDKQWRRVCAQAGVEDLHFHDLRHTFATRLTSAGIPTAEAMRITGHVTPGMLYRYINPGTDALHRAAGVLDVLNQQNEARVVSELIN